MPTPIFYTNASLSFGTDDLTTTVYTDQRFPLLTSREEGGRRFRFVKYVKGSGNVVAAAGSLVYYTSTEGQVTGTESDSLAPAGVLMGIIADTGFGWIQTRGMATGVKTIAAGDIITGDALIETTTNGGVSRISATWFTTTAATLAQIQRVVKVVGYAVAAESASAVSMVLTCE